MTEKLSTSDEQGYYKNISCQNKLGHKMEWLKLFSSFIVLILLMPMCLGAPMTGEDDEYDDDPELPDRKATMQKLQEEMEKQEQDLLPAYPSSSTTSTTPKPQRIKGYKQKRKWVVAKDIRGYQVLTDGPKVHAEMIKIRPMLKITVQLPDHAVRHVEKVYQSRSVELKIRNWNRVFKVHVKVPFGYQPSDLKIYEMRDRIEIVAPVYSEIDESGEL